MIRMSTPRTTAQRVILGVGSIGPLGHLPASGTATVAIVGLPLFGLMHEWPGVLFIALTAIVTLTAVWLHTLGDRLLGEQDSRKLVWDEVVGFLIAVAFVPFTWQLAVMAFVVERTIDIVKIPPANWIDKNCKSGWGVVGDDVVAGLYTCGILHAVIHFAPTCVGVAG